MDRILQVLDCLDMGGIQTFIMNVYRNIDREKLQFDFLVFRPQEQFFEKEILSLGGNVYKVAGRREGIWKHKKALKDFFENHPEYKVIHYHTSSLSDVEVLIEAKRGNVPVRVIHSHNTKASGSKIHTFLHHYNKKRINNIATDYLACGELAAEWFYRGTPAETKAVVVYNGIDCSQYAYNESLRKKIRKELGIENCLVIGHVGRFAEVKNHKFLIELFAELCQHDPTKAYRLLLVGDGPLKTEMEQLVNRLQISDKVLFLGNRSDVASLLQGMDVMVMPSFYEGFPVAAIEAQAASLPCFLSDSITAKAAIKANVHMIGLNEPFEKWISEILGDTSRIVDNTQLIEAGFDIRTTVEKLKTIYKI